MSKKVKWYYHRNGWNTCLKIQEFLVNNKIEVDETVLSSKQKIQWEGVEEILKEIKQIYSSRGKRVSNLKINTIKKQKTEIEKLILGPTGNLRAPSIIRGKTLIVGFHEDTYNLIFKNWSIWDY